LPKHRLKANNLRPSAVKLFCDFCAFCDNENLCNPRNPWFAFYFFSVNLRPLAVKYLMFSLCDFAPLREKYIIFDMYFCFLIFDL